MKPTTAIKKAGSLVGQLQRTGNAWAYLWYDQQYNAYRSINYCDYWQAYSKRRTSLIETALRLLFPDQDQELAGLQPEYRSGRWQNWVWQIYQQNQA
jgi:hypothetical protein